MIDYSLLNESDKKNVQEAISNKQPFFGYIPEYGFEFILNNYKFLAKAGVLEESWMQAYIHSTDFSKVTMAQLKEVFEACLKSKLQEAYPIPEGHKFSGGKRFSLFRGCAGPIHNL
ncbi:hypothetical protein P3559_24815, partial [Vibrio parahaemolyticus]|nr:hypothetical protein [Vibrio parahaemolyticus]